MFFKSHCEKIQLPTLENASYDAPSPPPPPPSLFLSPSLATIFFLSNLDGFLSVALQLNQCVYQRFFLYMLLLSLLLNNNFM